MLKQRIITALVLLPIVLWGLFGLGAEHFGWFVSVIVGLGAWEWARLSGLTSQLHRWVYAVFVLGVVYLAHYFAGISVLYVSLIWWAIATFFVLTYPSSVSRWRSTIVRLLLGVLTLVPLWVGMVFIRTAEIPAFPELDPLWVLLYVMMIVWVADTGAYFAGKAWGKRKLAPAVSPGKSWAGVWGGVAATSILALLASWGLGGGLFFCLQLVLLTLMVTAVSVIGDLTESMFKREEGIKDSSQLLPGHGGVLDRIDSMNAAIPVFACLAMLLGWVS